jgi:outer membrane protein OmpA-like peptidoglycan-associated protein
MAGIHVRGFADATGGDAINQKLSQERAQNVADYLLSKGIPRERLAPLGFSSEFPAADNQTAQGRRNNRRVEVTVR